MNLSRLAPSWILLSLLAVACGSSDDPAPGGSPQAGSGGSSQAGSGGSSQAGEGGSSQAGSGGSPEAGSGGSPEAGSGGAAPAGSGEAAPAGSGGAPTAGSGGSTPAGGQGGSSSNDELCTKLCAKVAAVNADLGCTAKQDCAAACPQILQFIHQAGCDAQYAALTECALQQPSSSYMCTDSNSGSGIKDTVCTAESDAIDQCFGG